MTDEPFDFTKFLTDAANPDEDTRREVIRDEVGDAMQSVMSDVAPRLWCILQEQMMKDQKSNIHLNAVINAAIFAVLSWICACTPREDTDGRDNDAVLREKFITNLDNALNNSRDNGAQMSSIAMNIGKLKLMEDACTGLGNVLLSNSMVIKGIHSHIAGKPGKPDEPQGAA